MNPFDKFKRAIKDIASATSVGAVVGAGVQLAIGAAGLAVAGTAIAVSWPVVGVGAGAVAGVGLATHHFRK
jgi:hypothetical protein